MQSITQVISTGTVQFNRSHYSYNENTVAASTHNEDPNVTFRDVDTNNVKTTLNSMSIFIQVWHAVPSTVTLPSRVSSKPVPIKS